MAALKVAEKPESAGKTFVVVLSDIGERPMSTKLLDEYPRVSRVRPSIAHPNGSTQTLVLVIERDGATTALQIRQ